MFTSPLALSHRPSTHTSLTPRAVTYVWIPPYIYQLTQDPTEANNTTRTHIKHSRANGTAQSTPKRKVDSQFRGRISRPSLNHIAHSTQAPPIQSVAALSHPVNPSPNAITMHFCPQVATPNIPNSTKSQIISNVSSPRRNGRHAGRLLSFLLPIFFLSSALLSSSFFPSQIP